MSITTDEIRATAARYLGRYPDEAEHLAPLTRALERGDVDLTSRKTFDGGHVTAGAVVIDDTNLFAEKLQEWEDYYNYHRPHGALGGQAPYEGLRQKAKTQRCDTGLCLPRHLPGRLLPDCPGTAHRKIPTG